MIRNISYQLRTVILSTLLLVPIHSQADITVERDDKEIHLNIRDGLNRLYLEVEVPFHEMGDVSKRLAAARAIYFLKQNLAKMWEEGKMPKTLADLMESSMTLGELQYDKIYQKISKASGASLRQVIGSNSALDLEKMTDENWWRPAGFLVEVGAKGRFKFSFLKGLSGTFAEVVIPQCVTRIRKIPLQEIEKNSTAVKMLRENASGIRDQAYNVILTKLYGRPCTENLEVLVGKLQKKEGNEFNKNYYFVEETFVKAQHKFIFWADTQIGSKKAIAGDKRTGFHGKFGLGIVYGKLTGPQDFRGMTLSNSKTFQLKASARRQVRLWIKKAFPRLTPLAHLSWGLHTKVGALVWKDRLFPYFIMGPEIGANISSQVEFNPGTVFDLFDFLNAFSDSMSESYSAENSGVQEDVFSLEEYAQERAKELKAINQPSEETNSQ